MKTSHSTMWKWCAGIALAGVLASASVASAQIVTFEFSALGGAEATAVNNAKDANLADCVISRSPTMPNAAANSGRFNSTNWAVTSIANAVSGGKYMEFTITPNSGYQFDVSSIYVQWQRSGTGNRGVSLRSSLDGYAADIGSEWALNDATTTQNNTWTFSQGNSSTPVTYRLYSWAEAITGTGGPGDGTGNDIVINGTVTATGGGDPVAPSVTTVAAGSIAATTATANGDVTDDGGDTVAERGVCYKTSSGVAISDNKTAAAAGGTGTYSVDLSSLSVNQIYYFTAYASNSVGETLAANELSFWTLANVPAAPTVDNPTATTLDVAVNANGNPASTEFAIQRTSDSLYLQADGSFGASEDWQTAAEWDTTTATGLASETEYSFQVKARNGASVETAFGSTASGTTAAAPTGIWINPMSAGTPMASYYLGDTQGEFFVNFEIGQETWNYAQVGLGTVLDGTGYNWGEATFYENGEGSNKRVRRNLSGFKFTSAANYYVICQAKANLVDEYTSKSGNGWSNSTAYPPADLASAYFAVSALNDPADPSADADQSTQINLLWSNNAQNHDVMVVHKLATDSWTEPTQGTSYAVDAAIGAGTVIYKGSSGVFYDTGLAPDTTYDYKFYSVNGDYYSAGVTAQETTLVCEPDAPTGLHASETNETSFTAAWTASDRATGYRLDVSTTEFGEEAVNLMANPGFEAGDSTGWDKFETEYAVVSTDPQEGSYHVAITATSTRDLTQNVSITGDGTTEYEISYWYKGTGNARIWAAWTTGGQVSGDSLQPGSYNPAAAEWTKMTYTVVPQSGENVLFYEIRTYNGASMQFDNFFVGIPGAEPPAFVAGYEDLSVAGTSQLVDGLDDNATYYFRVRAEGEGGCPGENSETANVTTLEEEVILPQARNTSGGAPEAPATIFLGDSGLTFGFDSWGQIEANYGAARLWLRHDNADLTGGTASDWTGFVNAEHKTVDSGTFDQAGTWYWGFQMDYGAEYGSAFWYKAASADWVDMSTAGDGATLTVTVSAINDPSGQTATQSPTEPTSSIDLEWALNAQGHDVMVVRKLAGDSWTEPTPGAAYVATDSLGAGTVVYVGSGTAASATGLADDSTYDFKFYSVNNDYYSAGVVAQAATASCAPAAPTGLDAVEDYTSFVASWEASTGATGYRLDVSTEEEFQSSGNGELFISEVADPLDVANAKFVELYNGTGAEIDFGSATWYLARQANGTTWANIQLTGTVPAGGTYVVAYSQTSYEATFGEAADQYSGNVSGNGDDGYCLVQGGGYSTGTVVDAYGVIDQDGTGYAWEYLDKNAVRNADVAEANATWTAGEWTLPATTVNTADMTPGAHVCTGDTAPSFVSGYSNLAVAGTSQLVEGLSEGVTYYFRVRAEGEGGCPSADSATASATTLLHLGLEVSRSTVNVREDGEGRFFVRLNKDPEAAVQVDVARSAGDASIGVLGGAIRTFNSSTWSVWQAVTLAQAADGNSDAEEATFQVSAAELDAVFVVATALDDDAVGENLALASGGAEISAAGESGRPEELIDGVHASSANYGFTVWTNDPEGTITLDLKSLAGVTRIRLLNWDWLNRSQRYAIAYSTDAQNWNPLIDASGADRQGWDDWAVADQSLRYLRITGLSNTENDYVLVSELEVYGTRDLSDLAQPVVYASTVNVREGGDGRFFVRLDKEPDGLVEVAVARTSGSDGVEITGGSVRIFKPSNWNVWQAVTLAAAADENAVGETATFRVSAPGRVDQYVTATVLESDVGVNLALASSGSTIAGRTSSRVAQLIDGIHTDNGNYGYTVWTNDPPGLLILDMKQTMILSGIRVLNWDWIHRTQRYTVESSEDGANWSPLVDASGEDHLGWDDWAMEDVSARYLRITGLTNSANQCFLLSEIEVYGNPEPLPQLAVSTLGVNVREAGEGRFFVRPLEAPPGNVLVTVTRVSGDPGIAVLGGATRSFTLSTWSTWQAVTLGAAADANDDSETATFRVSAPGYEDVYVTAAALDDDVGENLALATAGTTVSGRSSSRRTQLIDGVHDSNLNYGYTTWTAEPAGTITLDLGSAKSVARIRLLNWDWIYRTQRYTVEASTDGLEWSLLADASGADRQGWDDWPVAEQSIRFLRFTGLANSANAYVLVSELEVYGPPPAGRRAPATAMAAAPVKATSVAAESEPVAVLTSEGAEDETGWDAVDGDDATAWVGQQAVGGYLVVEYAPTLTLSALEVELADGSSTGIEVLTSLDAKDWQPLPEDLEANPVSLNFLWLVFPDDGTDAAPEVIEIRPNP